MAFRVVLAILLMALLGCGGGGAAPPATLTAITITPAAASIAPGTRLHLAAIGRFSDNSTQDVTSSVTWSSSDTAVITLDNSPPSKGTATAVTAGTVTVTAVSGTVTGITTLISAGVLSISLFPENPVVMVGSRQNFRATALLSTNATQDVTSSASWSSSSPPVATIDSAGIATAVGAGSCTITATLGGVSGATTLTSASILSLAVTPANIVLPVGGTQQLTATAALSTGGTRDVTSIATWSSAGESATVSSTGTVSAVTNGTATITATVAGVSGSTTVTSQAPTAITVTPVNPSAVAGSTVQFTAMGTFADGAVRDVTPFAAWSSSNPVVATVGNTSDAKGIATALSLGTATITATIGVSGATMLTVKTLTSLTISPVSTTLGPGTTRAFTVIGTFSDGSTQDLTSAVTWNSGNSGVATISNSPGTRGVVTTAGFGTTTITATLGGVSGSTQLTVARTGQAYVANSGSNTFSIIDTAASAVVGTVTVGAAPRAVAVSGSANRLYVANGGNNSVTVIDTTINAPIATIAVGAAPQALVVDPTANRLYVANGGSNTVSVIDTGSTAVVTTILVGAGPVALAVNPEGGRLYVANNGSNTVSVISTASNAVLATVPVGGIPRGIAVNGRANRLYIANSGSNTLTVLETAGNTVLSTIPVGAAPEGVAVNGSDGHIFVANSGGNTVSVVDPGTASIIATIPVGGSPRGVTLAPGTGRLYVANFGSNTVSVIDISSSSVVATIPVGAGPLQVAVVP